MEAIAGRVRAEISKWRRRKPKRNSGGEAPR